MSDNFVGFADDKDDFPGFADEPANAPPQPVKPKQDFPGFAPPGAAASEAKDVPAQQRLATENAADQSGPEPSWSEVGSGALKNALPNLGSVLKQTARGLTVDLPQTAESLKDLGKGALSKVGALGDQTPDVKAQSEAVLDAYLDHLKTDYTTVGGFKKALMNRPAEVASDLALPFTGGLGATADVAKVAGLSGTARALATAAKYGKLADPITGALAAAKGATKAVGTIPTALSAITAQVPYKALTVARTAGATDNPVLRQAFVDHFSGAGNATDIYQAAQSALNDIKADASADYMRTKGNVLTQQRGQPSFAPIDQAITDARAKTQFSGINNPNVFGEANKALDKIQNVVDTWKNTPTAQTLEGFDNLKQAVWDIADDFKNNNQASQASGKVYNAVKKSISDISPEYLQLMEDYQNSQNNIRDITKTLKLGPNAAATNSLASMLKDQRARGSTLLDQIADKDQRIPFMLSGAALRPYLQHGWRGMLEGLATGSILGGGLATGVHPALAVGSAVASAAAQSPHIAGKVQQLAGASTRLAENAAPVTMPARYAAEAMRPGDGGQEQQQDTSLSRGDRNNNFGNLEATEFTKAQRGYAGSDGRFALFKTPQDGTRAADALLKSKFNGGMNTIDSIVDSWTPSTERGGDNDPEVVAAKKAAIARAIGVSPYQKLDMSDDKLRERFLSSLFQTEGSGPRIQRASGGRITNHKAEAHKLLAACKTALARHNKRTEPILKTHDDAVASALKIADAHI